MTPAPRRSRSRSRHHQCPLAAGQGPGIGAGPGRRFSLGRQATAADIEEPRPTLKEPALKVMIRKTHTGVLTAYVPNKDLDENIVAQQHEGLWGGTITLATGWLL